ncbi:unnamed protein product [Ceratitis capitata]|uniref:(Mediterranean fruit fly) hypothetical protein n=1 Tax=Ceratitis capitata TaxID=7213 RepID=A0A811VG74_CERCA|nr:unnamed protein product [Ceratitis capitata]
MATSIPSKQHFTTKEAWLVDYDISSLGIAFKTAFASCGKGSLGLIQINNLRTLLHSLLPVSFSYLHSSQIDIIIFISLHFCKLQFANLSGFDLSAQRSAILND